jgi:hypothetical protein
MELVLNYACAGKRSKHGSISKIYFVQIFSTFQCCKKLKIFFIFLGIEYFVFTKTYSSVHCIIDPTMYFWYA